MSSVIVRWRRGVVALIVGTLLALGAPALAWADSANDQLVAIDSRLSSAVDAFGKVYQDSQSSSDEVISAAGTFKSAAEKAKSDFESAGAGASDGNVASYAKKFSAEAGDMATAAGGIADAFRAQDSSALTAAETKLSDAFTAYQKSADEYNNYLKTAGDPAFVGWLILLIVAVVLLVLALLFALLTRKQVGLLAPKTDKKGKVTQSSLKRLRWLVVLWAAVFVVGALIPFLQVVFAQPDASGHYTYRVFWYPLAAGVLLIIGVIQYFIAAAKVRREGSALPVGHEGDVAASSGYPGAPQYPATDAGAPAQNAPAPAPADGAPAPAPASTAGAPAPVQGAPVHGAPVQGAPAPAPENPATQGDPGEQPPSPADDQRPPASPER